MKVITNLESKGYAISFLPITCIIDENGYNPSIAIFCVHVSNFKIYPIGLTEYASDIMTGLSRAIKRYRSKERWDSFTVRHYGQLILLFIFSQSP
jgi:hypothetical protein